ncbi:MAG: Ig-like domain-containing protein [Pseudomonadota bacterium]
MSDSTTSGGESVVLLSEDFDNGSSSTVEHSDYNHTGDSMVTNGSNDGTLLFQEVDMANLVNGQISLSAQILSGGFEEWGSQYGDMLRIELVDQDGNVIVLDTFSGTGQTLFGSVTGQKIDADGEVLNYDVPEGLESFSLRITSDISAGNEKISLDNIEITAMRADIDPDRVVLLNETFGSSGATTVASSDFNHVNGEAVTNGSHDGALVFNSVSMAGMTEGRVDFAAQILGGGFEEWGSQYGDMLRVELVDQDGNVIVLDTFSGTGNTLVGGTTGQVINTSGGLLSYDVPEGLSSFTLRIASDISANSEKIAVDNVSISAKAADETAAATEGDGDSEQISLGFNDLPAGTVLSDQYAAQGVTISSASGGNPVMIFDTANPTGGDSDLATSNLGGVLILSEDGDSSDPDDNAGGGTFVFDFEGEVTIDELGFLDIEGGEAPAVIRLYDAAGNEIAQIDVPATGDNGQAVQAINVSGVARMEVTLNGSGAIDNLVFTRDLPPSDEPDPAPEPTIDAQDDYIVVSESEGAGDLEDVLDGFDDDTPAADILANDDGGDGSVSSVTIDGTTYNAGEWVDLADGGRVKVNADGTVDFDADGDFNDLKLGESRDVSFQYTISGAGGTTTAMGPVQSLDFNALAAGTIVDDEFAAEGVTVSSLNSSNPVMIFDTSNPTGGDDDLATTNRGNVLILSEDGDSSDPDDNASGGTFVFDFAGRARVDSITFLDIEGNEAPAVIRLYDADGNQIRQIDVSATGDNGQAVQAIDTDGVAKMEVMLRGSGAIDDLVFALETETQTTIEDTATVTVRVEGEIAPPDATDNVYEVAEDESVLGNLISDDTGAGVDSDPDMGPLAVTGLTDSFGNAMSIGSQVGVSSDTLGFDGSIIVNADGSFIFEPGDAFLDLDEGESDTVSFSYTITDDEGATDTADVTITVNGLGGDEPPSGGDVPTPADLNVIYLVDTSASMFLPANPNNPLPAGSPDNNGDLIANQIDLISYVVGRMSDEFMTAGAEVAQTLFSFTDTAVNEGTFMSSEGGLVEAINGLTMGSSGTDFDGAISAAASFISGLDPTAPTQIYFMTDGLETEVTGTAVADAQALNADPNVSFDVISFNQTFDFDLLTTLDAMDEDYAEFAGDELFADFLFGPGTEFDALVQSLTIA